VAAGPLSGLGIERFGITCVPWLLAAVSAVCVLLAWRLAATTRSRPSSNTDTDVRSLVVH
jgi:hypothetical protein